MEKDILYYAMENFSANSNSELELELFDGTLNNALDGKFRLKTLGRIVDFAFTVKEKLTLSKLLQIKEKIKLNNLLLVSDYIPESAKNYLKDENISYLDAAGNAFITNNNYIFVYIETKKKLSLSSTKPNRAFSKSGLKVIYQMLINEELVNKPYRNIGRCANVSIDTVGKVFRGLLNKQFLIRLDKKKFKLQNKEKLLQEWTILFNRVLRPKLRQRTFKLSNTSIKEVLNDAAPNSVGGELAAEFLTDYLIPEQGFIYTDQPFVVVARKLELRPDDNGSITIIEKFWKDDLDENTKIIVHPILVYADLLNDPKPRNLEAAKIIYDKYVRTTL